MQCYVFNKRLAYLKISILLFAEVIVVSRIFSDSLCLILSGNDLKRL